MIRYFLHTAIMKSLPIIGTTVLLSSALLFLAGCSSNPEATEAAKMRNNKSSGYIVIDQNNIDMKTIRMSEGRIDIPFSFRNRGNESLAILEGQTSCMCTVAIVKSSDNITSPRITMAGHGQIARINQVLEPGEEAQLIATFDPNAHGPNGTGPIMRDVTLNTNSIRTPTVTFRFNGTIVP